MLYTALMFLSAATLLFEINLTRLFSVAQFYHFAWLIISLALLGYGASGTALALFSQLRRGDPRRRVTILSLGAAISLLGSYLLVNWFPFDSFSIAVDRRQLALLAMNYLVLAVPFFFNGLTVGFLLTVAPEVAGRTYGFTFFGSAIGCLLVVLAPSMLGGEGVVVLSTMLASLAALVALIGSRLQLGSRLKTGVVLILVFVILIMGGRDLTARLLGMPTWRVLELRLSPYKGLSYALQYPGSQVIFQRWNAYSRVDVVHSQGVRSLPGLSYRFPKALPEELGLLVDGDDLNPIVFPNGNLSFAAYMPSAITYQLRPQAEVLVLQPRGGLDVVIALALGAQRVTAVEMNELIAQAASAVYEQSRVQLVLESPRTFLKRIDGNYDVVVVSLTSAYHPIRSGAYSLGEDYQYTDQAFRDAIQHLNSEGLLVVSRWLQLPPSEWLRSFALAITALEQLGLQPADRVVAFRGYNLGTILVKKTPFEAHELASIRSFLQDMAFDLVYAPDVRPEDVNRFNRMQQPVYYRTFQALMSAPSRQAWYASYDYDVRPSVDDHPFFGHYFKWSQASQMLAELGKFWQPFGGAGYFVLLAALGLALLMATGVILLPLLIARGLTSPELGRQPLSPAVVFGSLTYFGLIGLGYLLVEIPFIQKFILYLGHPAYAMATVLFGLLVFSGLGSQFAYRMGIGPSLVGLVGYLGLLIFVLDGIFQLTLGWPLAGRILLTLMLIAPAGFGMGVPFPGMIRSLEGVAENLIPWVWGINGSASVVSSVAAALMALSFGFRWVLLMGLGCYVGAGLTARVLLPRLKSLPPR